MPIQAASPDKPVEPVESLAGLPPEVLEQEVEKETSTGDEVETSWVEIQLVDEAGKPVCGERCRVMLSTGRTMRSVTDSDGMIRLENIPAGPCDVTFEELDQETWEKA